MMGVGRALIFVIAASVLGLNGLHASAATLPLNGAVNFYVKAGVADFYFDVSPPTLPDYFSCLCEAEAYVEATFDVYDKNGNQIWPDPKNPFWGNDDQEIFFSINCPVGWCSSLAEGGDSGAVIYSNLPNGRYTVDIGSDSWCENCDAFSYSIRGDVALTPAPRTLPLFAGGLGFLVLLSWCRRNASCWATLPGSVWQRRPFQTI
jgi:hypothetical protein